eukprot:915-Amorphochlora_amoeboformis.AAC.1
MESGYNAVIAIKLSGEQSPGEKLWKISRISQALQEREHRCFTRAPDATEGKKQVSMRLTACILAILPLTHPFSSGIRVASRYVPQKGFGNHALRRGSPYLLRMRATLEGLREGDNVQVVGMKRLKNWEGKQGRVVGQDAQSSKVLVKFPDEDTPLAMSPDRLRRVQPSGTSSESAEIEGTPEVGMRAKIVGMKRLKQYEGREGLVTGMDNATGRLRITISHVCSSILLDGETEPLMMAAAVLQRVSDGSSVTCGRVELPPGSVELKNDSGYPNPNPNPTHMKRWTRFINPKKSNPNLV